MKRNDIHFHQGWSNCSCLYIFNIITVKSLQWITTNVTVQSPSQEANSCSATHSIPCLSQNMWVHYYFHHSLTHTISPNFFSPSTFCSHIYSSRNNIAFRTNTISALQTPCWHNKMWDKKSETLTHNRKTDVSFLKRHKQHPTKFRSKTSLTVTLRACR